MARINLSIDEKVFEEFSFQAQKENKTLFAFANESLSVISKICAEGGTPEQVGMLWKAAVVLRQIDVMTLPEDFLDSLIEKLYTTDKNWTLHKFAELGASMVGLIKMVVGDVDRLSEVAKDFSLILPIKRFEITRTDVNQIQVEVIGAGRKLSSTECSLEFLKEALNGYGYTIVQSEIGVGTIRATAIRRGQR